MLGLSLREAQELLKSTLIVALVFTIASKPDPDPVSIGLFFAITLLCAGLGFILHELMHKLLAQRLGYLAEYSAGEFPWMSVLVAFAGWIFLSPGAVYIASPTRPLTKTANGLISLAGPLTNLFIALGFRVFAGEGLVGAVGYLGWDINIWLAIFNLVPAPGFDGQKVLAWNKPVYAMSALAVAACYFLLRNLYPAV